MWSHCQVSPSDTDFSHHFSDDKYYTDFEAPWQYAPCSEHWQGILILAKIIHMFLQASFTERHLAL